MLKVAYSMPSINRIDWLKKCIPNLMENLINPFNESSPDIELTLVVHVQSDEDVDLSWVDLSDRLRVEIHPTRNIGLFNIRNKFATSESMSEFDYIIIGDDDVWIVNEDHTVVTNLYKALTHAHLNQSAGVAITGRSVNFNVIKYQNDLHRKSILGNTKFVIFPRQFLIDIYKLIDEDQCSVIKSGEDTTRILMWMVMHGDFYYYSGFKNFIHIGFPTESHPQLDSIKKLYDFDSTGLNSTRSNGRKFRDYIKLGQHSVNVIPEFYDLTSNPGVRAIDLDGVIKSYRQRLNI